MTPFGSMLIVVAVQDRRVDVEVGYDLEAFVTERIGLEEVEEAFHKMERGEVLRSVVVL